MCMWPEEERWTSARTHAVAWGSDAPQGGGAQHQTTSLPVCLWQSDRCLWQRAHHWGAVCRKSGTHGFEAEVEGAIPPSTVTGPTSRFVSMWPPWGDGWAPCANTRQACSSNWRYITSITIFACLTPASASPCRNPSQRTATARPNGGSPGRQPWRLGWRTTSGPYARCCCFACRRGRSQQGCAPAGWWETATGGDLRGDVCLHGRLRGHHHGAEGYSDAMRALSSRPFCPCNGRRVSLWYLSAGCRYTASITKIVTGVCNDLVIARRPRGPLVLLGLTMDEYAVWGQRIQVYYFLNQCVIYTFSRTPRLSIGQRSKSFWAEDSYILGSIVFPFLWLLWSCMCLRL